MNKTLTEFNIQVLFSILKPYRQHTLATVTYLDTSVLNVILAIFFNRYFNNKLNNNFITYVIQNSQREVNTVVEMCLKCATIQPQQAASEC